MMRLRMCICRTLPDSFEEVSNISTISPVSSCNNQHNINDIRWNRHRVSFRMGKLTCGCLNVKIHTKKPDLTPVNKPDFGIEEGIHEFFDLSVAQVQLDLEGIRSEQTCLIRQFEVAGWFLSKCINCDMWTHAIHVQQGINKILVNTSLKSDPTIIERLEKSADFSPLYKIILRNKNDNVPVRSLGLHTENYDSVQQTLNTIQQRLTKFLVEEEASLEERIRKYEEEQRQQFGELQSKVRRDKNMMINLVLSTEEQDSDNNSDAMPDSPISPFSPVSANDDLEASTELSDDSIHRPSYLKKTPQHDLKHSQPKTVIAKSKPKRVTHVTTKPGIDDDGFQFDLDGFDGEDVPDSRPFYESDEETEDTDDSEAMYSPQRRRDTSRAVPLSASVPVSIPHWQPQGVRQNILPEDLDEEDYVQGLDPDRMAASIQALARSVHGDGTEMFGDRPRPRLNTMDLGHL